MQKWLGSAGVCIRGDKVLMVLQGTADEPKRWSVPSGGLDEGETFEECCIREVREETGFKVKVIRTIFNKVSCGGEVRYFEVEIIGGKATIQDPDHLIYDIAWKGIEEIKTLELSFPEDRDFLITLLSFAYCGEDY
ncbi:NUDIX hydrolase [Cytobacillus firmus]|uniref:NUDIX hydrolase n=1 Tax=Cytobacillus firmus TaxID=1399 RepID=UPI002494A8E2|nr:NUDIX hydrolase [Cytobacillus firmus]